MGNYPNLYEVFFFVKPPQLPIVYRKLSNTALSDLVTDLSDMIAAYVHDPFGYCPL